MEMVSQPDLHTPAEARAYLLKLRAILRTLGVSDADMEKGQMRCDVNVSLGCSALSSWAPKSKSKT